MKTPTEIAGDGPFAPYIDADSYADKFILDGEFSVQQLRDLIAYREAYGTGKPNVIGKLYEPAVADKMTESGRPILTTMVEALTEVERLEALGEPPSSIKYLVERPEEVGRIGEQICDCMATVSGEPHLADCPARGLT